MLISVLGNIIDTKDIYRITPIEGNNCWDSGFHSSLKFRIISFNDKIFDIELEGTSFFKNNFWYQGFDRKEDKESDKNKIFFEKIKTIENELNKVREKVITYWNKSKSDIPQIEFEIEIDIK